MKENSIEEITFVENEIKNTKRLFEEVGCYAFFDEDLCKAIEYILSDYKKLQEEFKQVNHECERLEKREEILNKYKLALFMVIRNFMIMPQGIKLGKADKEINEMSYETMCKLLTMIDYNKAEKFYEEGKKWKKIV